MPSPQRPRSPRRAAPARAATFVLVLAGLLAGCAPPPGAIKPARVEGGGYAAMSCTAAVAERDRVQGELDTLSARQRKIAAADAVGVALVLIPPSAFTGASKRKEIAANKGRLAVLDKRLASCPAPRPAAAPVADSAAKAPVASKKPG